MRFLQPALSLFAFLIVPITAASADEPIPREDQIQIIESYLYATGRLTTRPASMAQGEDQSDDELKKCGTPAAMNFAFNRHRIDRDLLESYGLALASTRPTGLPLTYTSPTGQFKIHYTVTGDSAVYHPTTDVAPANGIPDYVDGVARIADSCHMHHVQTLGYPTPPSDGFYAAGGDSAYDIYLSNLSGFYGLTYPDSISIDGPGSIRATSYLELDNDYQELPNYVNRPLDAVRVTVAHEYFHSVQFGIDITEAEDYNDPVLPRRYWMEMSAVWMEEEMYDNINDYYGYLPHFFNRPGRSIQQFSSLNDQHPYASAVFPIFLSELFGRNVIKSIWLRCGTMGPGANFLDACEEVFDSILPNPDAEKTFPLVFRQFAFWNYYTGSRASLSPNNLGYSERFAYPEIPMDSMIQFNDSILILANQNRRNPDHNAAAYVVWHNPRCLKTDTVTLYGQCVPNADSCYDTLFVRPNQPYDFTFTDTFTTLVLSLDPTYVDLWGLVSIFELEGYVDSFEVAVNVLAGDQAQFLFIPNQELYSSITFIATPASVEEANYSFGNPIRLGVYADEAIDPKVCGGIPSATLVPFPNPAVLSKMGAEEVGFALKYPQGGAYLFEVDIYNEAGEYLNTVSRFNDSGTDTYTVFWNMRSAAGTSVSSGVYLLYGRLFEGSDRKQVITEDRSKLLIVR